MLKVSHQKEKETASKREAVKPRKANKKEEKASQISGDGQHPEKAEHQGGDEAS